MIKTENLSYSFPHKELYNKISFTLEDDVHCAFIGTNGTGKSTLVNMILHPDKYLYDGKLIVDVPGRIGYVSQFYTIEREKEVTVFDYISEDFVRLQNKINQICENMATTDHLEELMEEYQQTLDEFNAIDGDFYESNIRKQLKTAGLAGYEDQLLTNLSGGEFKLVQAIREMMISPKFIIMDEPTSHLDTYSQLALEQAIEKYNGTVLMVSHDFYTVANCMDYVLLTEDKGLRRVSMRKFRKMIYADHFDKDYLEYEQKKKELENRIAFALQAGKYEDAKKISEELEKLLRKYNG